MTAFPVRHFDTDDAVERVGEGLLARNLPREEWTHEAHLAATVYLSIRHPQIDLETELPGLIRRYNESLGGINDDTQGYHDTITKAYLRGVCRYLETADCEVPLRRLVNGLLDSPIGRRDWPLRFWSKEKLFSIAARRSFVEPDLANFP